MQVYDLTQLISSFYIKTYAGLTKIQRIEWNSRWGFPLSNCWISSVITCAFINLKSNFCRGISSIHAIFITALSLHFVFWSDLFSDQTHAGLVTFRSSPLSVFGLGVCVSYYYLMKLATQLISRYLHSLHNVRKCWSEPKISFNYLSIHLWCHDEFIIWPCLD